MSSHKQALHAAAPCPADVKRRMIDWWGPIVWEYYTGSERARVLLADWPKALAKFRKVMPVEYRRALAEMARQQEADKTGLEVLEIGLPLKAKGEARKN